VLNGLQKIHKYLGLAIFDQKNYYAEDGKGGTIGYWFIPTEFRLFRTFRGREKCSEFRTLEQKLK
jgi:hypothetical protein